MYMDVLGFNRAQMGLADRIKVNCDLVGDALCWGVYESGEHARSIG